MNRFSAELIQVVFALVSAALTLGWLIAKLFSKHELSKLREDLRTRSDRVFAQEVDIARLSAERERLGNEAAQCAQENTRLRNQLADAERSGTTTAQQQRHLDGLHAILDIVRNPKGELWSARPPSPDDLAANPDPNGCKVLSVVSFKGGVGKTTVAMNLGAYFATQHGMRVLFVDMDYQASLANLLVAAAETEGYVDNWGRWILPDMAPIDVLNAAVNVGGAIENACLIDTGYALNTLETREMLRWIVKETDDDVRFRLKRVLHHEAAANRFDLVIIDTPPRPSTGTINALLASDYYVIPTNLNRVSSDPTDLLLQQINSIYRPLNPNLKLLGVVGNRTHQGYDGTQRTQREAGFESLINTVLEGERLDARVFTQTIPNRSVFAMADDAVPYFTVDAEQRQQTQKILNALGDEVFQAMNWPR